MAKTLKKPRKQSAWVVISLRIKEPLRKQIETSAKHNGVSMNREITDRLVKSFTEEELRKAYPSQ